MPVRIIFDYPGRQISSSIARTIAWIVGTLLTFIGLVATVIAIPTGFVLVGDVMNQMQSKPEDLFGANFPLRQVELGFVGAVLLAWFGVRYGRRLVRGRRTVVLFLRRFGYRGSMQAVTFAVANTIGSAWRLVTLDDQEMAPVGVDSTSRFLFGAGGRIARLIAIIGKGVMAGLQWTLGGMWAVVAAQVLVAWPNWRGLLTDGTLDGG